MTEDEWWDRFEARLARLMKRRRNGQTMSEPRRTVGCLQTDKTAPACDTGFTQGQASTNTVIPE